MKMVFAPNQASSLVFESLTGQKVPDQDFIPQIDTIDISVFNGKKFIIAQSAGDATSPDVIGSSIVEDLNLADMLEQIYVMRSENYTLAKLFMLDGDKCYLVDPKTTELLSVDPAYYADSMDGNDFPSDTNMAAPAFALVARPKDELNTLTVFNSATVLSRPGESPEDVLQKLLQRNK